MSLAREDDVNAPGFFFVLDGPDGSGKTTQAARLAAWLDNACGLVVRPVREPGGTAVGEGVRAILLDPAHGEMTVETELLLYMASRAQLTRQVIRPALHRGEAVVADRFLVASAVYQGLAGGVPLPKLLDMGRFATGGLVPDLTVLFDVAPEVGLARNKGEKDRMESKDLAFHRRVRQGYLEVAGFLPGRVEILDGAGAEGDIFEALRSLVADVLENR